MSTNRLRKRKRCLKCNQELSHSAYVRHQNPVVCPESSVLQGTSSETPINNITRINEPGDILDNIRQVDPDETLGNDLVGSAQDSSVVSSVSSSENESVDGVRESIDIFSDNDCTDHEELPSKETTVVDEEGMNREQMKIIATHICLFVSFFQLCYRVSHSF